jgi:DHA2 family methylenomycin A resistance protein-like MFS transporter
MGRMEQAQKQAPSRWPLITALRGGYFLVLLGVTVVNVALPQIGASLRAGRGGLTWVVDAYTIPLASLLLICGAIGDRIGHRQVVIAGFAGFGAASVLCALAPNMAVLVAGRALQGIGAALVLSGSLALLTSAVTAERARARVVGIWAAVGGMALPAGLLAGGMLVQAAGWRAVFWPSVPVIVLALAPIIRLPRQQPHPSTGNRVDWVGAVLLAITVGGMVTAIIEVRARPMLAGIAAAVAVLAGVTCWRVERRAVQPLLRVSIGARLPLAAACAVAELMNLCALGALFLLTQIFQGVHHLRPMAAGLLLVPAMLPLPLLGVLAGRLTGRYGPWQTSALGLIVAAAGFAGMAASVAQPVYPVLLSALAIWGIGLGILTPAIVTAALRAAPDAAGIASGASNTARQIGAALGVAAFGTIAASTAATAFASRSAWLLAGSALLCAAAAAFCLALHHCAWRRR